MTTLFPSCLDAVRRISERQDAPLGGAARFGLWLHISVCGHCRHYSRQLRLLRSFLGQYPDRLSELKLSDRARSEIVRKLVGEA